MYINVYMKTITSLKMHCQIRSLVNYDRPNKVWQITHSKPTVWNTCCLFKICPLSAEGFRCCVAFNAFVKITYFLYCCWTLVKNGGTIKDTCCLLKFQKRPQTLSINMLNCSTVSASSSLESHDIMLLVSDQLFTDRVKWGHISQVAALQVFLEFYKCK